MVRSWVCPRCLGDLDSFYTEEGSTIVASEKVVCPHCGYTIVGVIDECCAEDVNDFPPQSADRHSENHSGTTS